MAGAFGKLIRYKRKIFHSLDPQISLRGIAAQVGIEPSYLSRIERGIEPPPSEATIAKLAKTLAIDSDELLALGGKVSTDVRQVIIRRPALMAGLVRQFAKVSDNGVQRVIQRARRTGKQ